MTTRAPKKSEGPGANDWGSPSHVQTVFLTGAIALGIYLSYRMAEPFLPALAWALALAVLFAPVQRRLESRLRRTGAAATLTVLIGLMVFIPAAFVTRQLLLEAVHGAMLIDVQVKSGEWRRVLEAQPRLAPFAERIEQQIDLPGTIDGVATWMNTTVGAIVTGSVYQVVGFTLTLYLLFFFLRDRRAVLQALRSLSPLSAAEMDRIFDRVSDTIFATVYGTLAVGAVQGLFGGLMFWWLGLPQALLWGVVMAFLAVVPVLGAFVVWIPAALVLALEGSWGKALILTLWGTFVVGTIDNLLQPILVGNRLKLHTALAFLSVIGGLMLFGPAGLILGPVSLTSTLVLLEIWRSRSTAEMARPELEE